MDSYEALMTLIHPTKFEDDLFNRLLSVVKDGRQYRMAAS